MPILGRGKKATRSFEIPERRKKNFVSFEDIRRTAAKMYLYDMSLMDKDRKRHLEIIKMYSSIKVGLVNFFASGGISKTASVERLIKQMVLDCTDLTNGKLEGYSKENTKMAKRGSNKERITEEEEKAELVTFISNMRRKGESFWWMGIYTGPNDRPKVISTSMRGFFKDMYWRPLDTERQSCCDAVEASIVNGVSAFIMTQHCASDEHVTNLINSRTDEELYAEYQYMLNETLDALVDGFGDD